MEIKEIWKDVIGYENLYQISNLGRIKSLGNGGSNNSKERIMKQKLGSRGYFQIVLCKKGQKKTFNVHRLVCSAFIPNPNNYPIINHKDENKQNNITSNLEWCTQEYNNIYGTKLERQKNTAKINNINKGNKYRLGKKHSQETKDKIGKANSIANSKPVCQLDKYGNVIKIWDSATQASNELGMASTNITACCKKRKNYKSAGGFRWMYLEEIKKAG